VTTHKTEKSVKPVELAKKNFWTGSTFAVAMLALIVIVVFAQFIFSDKMLFGSDTMNGLDTRIFLKTSIEKFHQFPMWFSPRLGGMPSVDAMFGDAMYLPTLIINAIFPISRALGIRLVLHVFLAGLFFFLMLKRGFKTSTLVAFIGGAFYMLNPEFFSHVYPGHDGKMFVIAWVPFVIWRVKVLMDTPNVLNGTLLSLGIAICLFTSHIQMSYFLLWGLFLYWILASILVWRKEKKAGTVFKMSAFFWAAIALGIGLALIQLLPSFMYVRDAFSVRGAGRGFEYAASWSLHWPETFSLWVPEFGNFLDYYWGDNAFKLNSEYAGAMSLLFAVLAVILKRKPWRIFWGAIGILGVAYAMGAHTPVFHIAYYVIPGVKKFRACSMLMFWFSFSTVLLASLFFKDVIGGAFTALTEKQKQKWSKGLLIGVASITVLSILFSMQGFVAGLMQNLSTSIADSQKSRIFEANFSKNFVPFLWVWWFFASASLLLLWGLIKGKISKQIFLVAILLIGLVDLIRIDSKFIKVVDPRPYFYVEQAVTDMQKEMQTEPFRCFAFPGTFGEQNAEGVYGLEGVSGFHDNELQLYRSFRGEQDGNYYTNLIEYGQDGRPYLKPDNLKFGNVFLNLANVKYYLFRQDNTLIKIPNEGYLGRISFVKNCAVFDSTRMSIALKRNAYDYKTTVGLIQEPSVKPMKDSTSASALIVQWTAYTPNFRKANVTVPADGFLRIAEVYYPGWQIRVDGQVTKYYRADMAWLAINITKGNHVVEMIPQSLYLKKAELVSYPLMVLLGLYWLIIGGLAISRRKK